jgi:hypothetical protein
MAPNRKAPDNGNLTEKKQKYLDLSIGFLSTALVWFFTFNPFWYIAPIVICIASGVALKKKVKRKYIPIGALSLFALPFIIWWSSILFSMGITAED